MESIVNKIETKKYSCNNCNKSFTRKEHLTNHLKKLITCVPASNVPASNELLDEIKILRNEIYDIKMLLTSFIKSSNITPYNEKNNYCVLNEPVEPIINNEPIIHNEPIINEPVYFKIPKKPRVKKVKPKVIIEPIIDPINDIDIVIDENIDENDIILTKLNQEFNDRPYIITQLKEELIKDINFKNIEIYNEVTDTNDMLQILRNPSKFITDIFNDKNKIKYIERLDYYIENIYKPMLKKNNKSYLYFNNQLLFKQNHEWNYESTTTNIIRETLDDTINTIIINTVKYDNHLTDETIDLLFKLKQCYNPSHIKEINQKIKDIFIS